MSNKRYPEEFKIEAVKQVTERGHSASEVASRLGVSQPTLYEWIKRYSVPEAQRVEQLGQSAEIRRLKAELKRVTEERDILKKAAAYFAKESR
jgi:transposase